MELQTEIGRQKEPPGNLFLLARGRQVLGQLPQELFLKAAFEEIPLVGLAEDFQGVELALAEGVQDALGMLFNKGQVQARAGAGAGWRCGPATVWVWAS